MPVSIELLIAVGAPVLALTILRINAALVFLSLCLGQVLVTQVAQDNSGLISFLAPKVGSASNATLQLAVLLLPAVLTAVIMLVSVHGRLKVTLNFLPALGTSPLGVLLAVPLLTTAMQKTIKADPMWQQLSRAQALIVGASAFISLIFLWTQRRSHHHDETPKH